MIGKHYLSRVTRIGRPILTMEKTRERAEQREGGERERKRDLDGEGRVGRKEREISRWRQ